MSRPTKHLFIAASLFFIFLLSVILLSDPSLPQRSANRFSTYNTKPVGLKAFYTILQERGFSPKRWKKSTTALTTQFGGGIFIVTPPILELTKKELDSLRLMVQRGSSLMIFYGPGLEGMLSAFHLSAAKESDTIYSSPLLSATLVDTLVRPELPDSDSLSVSSFGVHVTGDPNTGTILYGTAKTNAVTEWTLGRGSVIVVNSPAYITNSEVHRKNSLRAMIHLITMHAGGDARDFTFLYFDEYHQGFQEFESIISLLDEIPIKVGLIVGALAFALWIVGRASRLGRPVPVVPRSKRSSIEYVESVSRVYEHSGAHSLILRQWFQWVMHDLYKRYRISDMDQLAITIAERFEMDRIQISRLFSAIDKHLKDAEINSASSDTLIRQRNVTIDEETLVQLCRQLDVIYFKHH